MVRSRPGLAELHVCGEAPEKAIAAILDREGFRPPKRASGFHGRDGEAFAARAGLAAAPSRAPSASAAVLSPGRVVVARPGAGARRASRRTRCTAGRREGWLRARQVGGRGGPWAVCRRTSPGTETACGALEGVLLARGRTGSGWPIYGSRDRVLDDRVGPVPMPAGRDRCITQLSPWRVLCQAHRELAALGVGRLFPRG